MTPNDAIELYGKILGGFALAMLALTTLLLMLGGGTSAREYWRFVLLMFGITNFGAVAFIAVVTYAPGA